MREIFRRKIGALHFIFNSKPCLFWRKKIARNYFEKKIKRIEKEHVFLFSLTFSWKFSLIPIPLLLPIDWVPFGSPRSQGHSALPNPVTGGQQGQLKLNKTDLWPAQSTGPLWPNRLRRQAWLSNREPSNLSNHVQSVIYGPGHAGNGEVWIMEQHSLNSPNSIHTFPEFSKRTIR